MELKELKKCESALMESLSVIRKLIADKEENTERKLVDKFVKHREASISTLNEIHRDLQESSGMELDIKKVEHAIIGNYGKPKSDVRWHVIVIPF